MTLNDLVRKLKQALNAGGASPPLDENNSNFGSVTAAMSDKFDIQIVAKPKSPAAGEPDKTPGTDDDQPQNPAYKEAKKYEGKGENDKGFVVWLSKYWPKTGLNYKTIIGASFAWCGLFFAAMHTDTGLSVIKGAAGAANWRKAGVAIEWKRDGIPQGAEVQIDHQGDCNGVGNHITWADGACAPQDLVEMKETSPGVWEPTSNPPKIKKGAQFPGFGGNQGNMVKRSMYGVFEICAVRWPHEIEKPGPVTKSIGCTGKDQGKESTR